MNESAFHILADQWLAMAEDVLEGVETLDVEYQHGVLTVVLPSGPTFVVNKHAPMKQLWLSSPISGGLHFSYNDRFGKWTLADGNELGDMLRGDLAKLGQTGIIFP
jgi:frataxin